MQTVKIGKLTGTDTPAFVRKCRVISALGDYWSLELWVYAPDAFCSCRLSDEKNYSQPEDDAGFFSRVTGVKSRTAHHTPADIARSLGWWGV